MKWLIALGAALDVASCAAVPAQHLVMRGAFDIELPAGAYIPEHCGRLSNFFETGTTACLAYDETLEGVNGWDWDSEILRSIYAHGWQGAGGAANVFYLDRRTDEDCWNRLYMIGELYGEPDDIAHFTGGPGEYDPARVDGLFVFFLEPDPVCGNDRYIHN